MSRHRPPSLAPLWCAVILAFVALLALMVYLNQPHP